MRELARKRRGWQFSPALRGNADPATCPTCYTLAQCLWSSLLVPAAVPLLHPLLLLKEMIAPYSWLYPRHLAHNGCAVNVYGMIG